MRYTARITDMMNAEILHNVDDRFTFSVINVHLKYNFSSLAPFAIALLLLSCARKIFNFYLLFNFSSLS